MVCRRRQDGRSQVSAKHQGVSRESRVEVVKIMAANFTVLSLTGFIIHICKAEPYSLDANSIKLFCCRPGLLTVLRVSREDSEIQWDLKTETYQGEAAQYS